MQKKKRPDWGRSDTEIMNYITSGEMRREQKRKQRKGAIHRLYHNIRRIDKHFGSERDIFYDKIKFHKELSSHGIRVPEIYSIMKKESDWYNFWEQVKDKDTFVFKPNRLSRGRGIHVLEKTDKPDIWKELSGDLVSVDTLKKEAFGFLRRQRNKESPHMMFTEERIFCSDKFSNISVPGSIVDFRVYVLTDEVLYAKMRCPTNKSQGLGNTSKSAIAMHIDILGKVVRTNIMDNVTVKYKNGDNEVDMENVKVPFWGKIVETSVKVSKIFKSPYHSVDLTVNQNDEVVVIESEKIPTLGHYSKDEANEITRVLKEYCTRELYNNIPAHRRGMI